MTQLALAPRHRLRTRHLSGGQLHVLRKRLLGQRQDALAQIEHLRGLIRDDSEHLIDDPDRRHVMIEEDHAITAGLLDREQARFEAIERALRRLDAGTYGFCVETGLPIPVERLMALPSAERLASREARAEAVPHAGRAPRAAATGLDLDLG